MIVNSLQSVLSLLLMMAVGFVAANKPWFGKQGENFLSKYCVNIGIPLYMVANVISTCKDSKELLYLLRYFPIPVVIILFFTAVGYVVSRILRVEDRRQGAFVNVMAFSNTVIIGFPVVTALFGEAALPMAMSYYIANTVLFWTIGAWFLRRDGGQKGGLFSKQGIKNMFTLPLLGFLLGAVLVLFDVELPHWLFNPIEQIGKTTTPLAMIVTGSVLRHMNLKEAHLSKDIVVLLLNRFVASPAILLLVYLAVPLNPMAKQVYFMLTVMPSMTQFGIVARESGADYEFCTLLIALTTVVSMALIPVYTMIMGVLFV